MLSYQLRKVLRKVLRVKFEIIFLLVNMLFFAYCVIYHIALNGFDLINVIYERTSLAEDIVKAKTYLGMDIYDANREKNVHEKAKRLANEKNIDKNSSYIDYKLEKLKEVKDKTKYELIFE